MSTTEVLDPSKFFAQPNLTGLPSLPAEFVLLVLSYLTDVPVPCELADLDDPETAVRSQALLALSLSCRWIRATVQPLLWQSLDVFRVSDEDFSTKPAKAPEPYSRAYRKALATQLRRKLEIVTIREPTFSSHVRTITVVLSDSQAQDVYPEFLRALSCLKNLKTLQIVSVPAATVSILNLAIRDGSFCFESVETVLLTLEVALGPIMSCLPNCRRVHVRYPKSTGRRSQYDQTAMILTTIGMHAKKIETLDIEVSHRRSHWLTTGEWRALSSGFPNIRRLPLPFLLYEHERPWMAEPVRPAFFPRFNLDDFEQLTEISLSVAPETGPYTRALPFVTQAVDALSQRMRTAASAVEYKVVVVSAVTNELIDTIPVRARA